MKKDVLVNHAPVIVMNVSMMPQLLSNVLNVIKITIIWMVDVLSNVMLATMLIKKIWLAIVVMKDVLNVQALQTNNVLNVFLLIL